MKTAKEILEEQLVKGATSRSASQSMTDFYAEFMIRNDQNDRNDFVEAMKEYAAQFIDIAAQRARISIVSAKSGIGVLNASGVKIDKMSILRIKESMK